MERTALTVGGFTQPTVSKALIELPSSIEKGFAQRFLWIFPQPSFSNFSTLELVNEKFSQYLGENSQLFNTAFIHLITLCIYIYSGEACKPLEE